MQWGGGGSGATANFNPSFNQTLTPAEAAAFLCSEGLSSVSSLGFLLISLHLQA